MRRRCITALIGGWMLVAGVAQSAPYGAGHVTVMVFDRGEPLVDANVLVDGQAAGRTDQSGVAELSTAVGRHQLEVQHNGVSQAAVGLSLGSGESAEVSVNLAGLGRAPRVQVRTFAVEAPGLISGVVRGPAGEGMSGAAVAVRGRAEAATTAEDGGFQLEVPRGVYVLEVSHERLQSRTFVDVRALSRPAEGLEFVLSGRSAVSEGIVEEVVVIGSYPPDTTIVLERVSESVLDVITEEEIRLAGDSTAIQALQRVTGVTVQNDIAIVRGLGERYSATFFNGAELPSPDPTRRAVGLNIFPSELTSGITVQKTYTADLPADFSGGAVRLQTRSIPDGSSGRISVSTGGNSRSTLADGFTHNGGDTDFLGIDDDDRAIPTLAGSLTDDGRTPLARLDSAQREQIAEELVGQFPWNLRGFELPADIDADFTVGNRFQTENVDFGVNLAGLYDSEWRYVDERRAEIIADARGNEFEGEFSLLERTENDVRAGGVLNLVADIGLYHTLTYTSFLSRESRKGTFFEEGFNRSDDRDFRRVVLEFAEAELFTNQVSGLHGFPDLGDIEISWQATYSEAQRDEPGTREYTYSKPEGSDLAFRLATGPGEAGLPPLLSWEYLDEDSLDASVELVKPLMFRGGEISGDFRIGGRITERDRTFESTRWRFALAPGAGSGDPLFFPSLSFPSVEMILTPERLGPSGFQLINASTALAGGSNADNYTGEHDIAAGYLMGDFDFGSLLRVQAGLRVESSDLFVATDAIVGGASQVGQVKETDYLPSLNVTWFLNDVSQLRFGVSQTINRPQFRELSPAPFRDPETRFETVGNPGLQQSEVTNLDVRYERYFSRNEGFTLAAFFKDLKDPIEVVTIGGGSDDRGVRSFANADSAELYGLELDGRLSLGTLVDTEGFLSDVYVTGNVAWIESEVTVGQSNLGIGTSNERELQGQSPWVVNVGLGYSSVARGTDALLLFNMFGERIVEAGVNAAPDAKEQPRGVLDFNLSQVFFDNWVVGLKLRNLLDSKFEVEQGSGTQRSFKTGREITLSLSVDF